MRWPVMHGPMRAPACSRSLLYPRVGETVFHRTLVNNVKAVFVLVAFRRFPQFSDNQRERTTHSRNEKACGYDHGSQLAITTLLHQAPLHRVPAVPPMGCSILALR